MPLRTYPFDGPEFLETPQAVDEYLISSFEDAAEFGNPRIIVACARGTTKMAQDAELLRTALYRALSARDRPELETVFKVMQVLGLRLAPVRVGAAA